MDKTRGQRTWGFTRQVGRQKFQKQIIKFKTFPGADKDTEHNLVMTKCRLKFDIEKRTNKKMGSRSIKIKRE